MPGDSKLKEENIATEILHKVKSQTKKWIIAFLIVLTLWVGTVGVFVWYLYQYKF